MSGYPYATVSLFHLSHFLTSYLQMDVSSGINEVREAWESQCKSFTYKFFEADPCTMSFFYYTPFGQYADVFPCVYEHVDVELCFLFP
ncbi:hypothetical protein ES288_D05G360500v1 [Gossypium darwinii]|nr:hypothetical protein ES288_D05G360500v1 [Gossypium darwinii]